MSQEKNKSSGEIIAEQAHIESAIHKACKTSFGVLDTNFLCRSVSVLETHKPLSVGVEDSIESVVELLRSNKVGCVLVKRADGKLAGIFSERDVLLKVIKNFPENKARPVSEFMTADPVTQPPDATIGFVLNLMSTGGFRHMPIVDPDGLAIGIVSVKDVVDFIVRSFTDDLLSFDTAGV
ncbi:MAG: CBS domain-containing protein [Deltaproteobacteria bacterium]|nr:CBS domain-containing protein [Deltaproteobacteria bacterium]